MMGDDGIDVLGERLRNMNEAMTGLKGEVRDLRTEMRKEVTDLKEKWDEQAKSERRQLWLAITFLGGMLITFGAYILRKAGVIS